MTLDQSKFEQEWSWANYARDDQLEPLDWLIWLIETGRGWGKTRTGAETTNDKVRNQGVGRVALVAPTAADARDTMVDELMQNSGILSVSSPYFMPKYEKSNRRLVWPNGAVAYIYSAEEPKRLRGPQHEFAWCDELAAWPENSIQEAWSNLMFGLRQGKSQVVITTTPRPIKFLRDMHKRHALGRGKIHITKGTTFDNEANLSDQFIEEVINPYKGTRVGMQELYGQLLDDNPDALWVYSDFENARVEAMPEPVWKIGMAIDPTGSADGHEVGIVIGATAGPRGQEHGYLLADKSMRGMPEAWAEAVINAYDEYDVDEIIVETNFGGEMVTTVLRLKARAMGHSPLNIVDAHASRGKIIRAEPVSGLYQRQEIHHVGIFEVLEDQMVGFVTGDTNDRVDANVWLWMRLLGHKLPKMNHGQDIASQFQRRLSGLLVPRHAEDRRQTTVMGSMWRKRF